VNSLFQNKLDYLVEAESVLNAERPWQVKDYRSTVTIRSMTIELFAKRMAETKVLNEITRIYSKKLRNKIAGYITLRVART